MLKHLFQAIFPGGSYSRYVLKEEFHALLNYRQHALNKKILKRLMQRYPNVDETTEAYLAEVEDNYSMGFINKRERVVCLLDLYTQRGYNLF